MIPCDIVTVSGVNDENVVSFAVLAASVSCHILSDHRWRYWATIAGFWVKKLVVRSVLTGKVLTRNSLQPRFQVTLFLWRI